MNFIAFSLGNLNVYWYGLIICTAIILGLIITKLNTMIYHEDFAHIITLMIWAIPCSVLGARAIYVLQHFDTYRENISSIFALSQGGLSIYGALIGFFAVLFFYLKRHKLAIYRWLDILVPAIILGIAILQIGNFMLQLSIGTPIGFDVPNDHKLAEYVEFEYRPSGFEGYQYFKPVAFYLSMANFALFILAVVFTLLNKWLKFLSDGTIFLGSIFCIALFRFIFGFMYLTLNKDVFLECEQWIALIVMIFIAILYFTKRFLNAKSKKASV